MVLTRVGLEPGKEAAVRIPTFQHVLQSVLLLTAQMLCKNIRDLEFIDVSNCAALTQRAIRAISFYCRGLNTLRMSGCPEVPHTLLRAGALWKHVC